MSEFFGRDEEIERLYGRFANVAETKHPRLAVIVAESGVGKSALVQALYEKLTHEKDWNGPGAEGYWPKAFQERGHDSGLRVNPHFPKGHIPEAAPKFMWMGMRWGDASGRNQEDRECPLPKGLEALLLHYEVMPRNVGVMKVMWDDLAKKRAEAARAYKEEGVAYLVEQTTGLTLGLAGPAVKLGLSAARKAADTKGSEVHSLVTKRERDAGDRLREELGYWMGRKKLPTIVWLDDAQWVDSSSLKFLGELFSEAKEKRWPLLVIATHWEREWRESFRPETNEAQAGLAFVAQQALAREFRTLLRLEGDTKALQERLVSEFPGLTESQKKLVVDKCFGNFQSLVEHIGWLRQKQKRRFQNGDPKGELSDVGVKSVREWPTERDKLVEKRFGDLDDEVQDILGWGSRVTSWRDCNFFRGIIVEFALQQLEYSGGMKKKEIEKLISACVKRYGILSRLDGVLYKFRDRAYYTAADQHFKEFLTDDDHALLRFVEDRLITWVNNCFDEDGRMLLYRDAPVSPLSGLPPSEKISRLEIVVEILSVQESYDWSKPSAVASLRAYCMLAGNYAITGLWREFDRIAAFLERIDWAAASKETPCLHLVNYIRVFLNVSGSGGSVTAKSIGESVLPNCLERYGKSSKLQNQMELCDLLMGLGSGYQAKSGEYGIELYKPNEEYLVKALSLWNRILEDNDTLDIRRSLAKCLLTLGFVNMIRVGDWRSAENYLIKASDISCRIAEKSGDQDDYGTYCSALIRLGHVCCKRDDYQQAENYFSLALGESSRIVQENKNARSLLTRAYVLVEVDVFDHTKGGLKRSEERCSEALEICGQLLDEYGKDEEFVNLLIYRLDFLLDYLLNRLFHEQDHAGELLGKYLELGRLAAGKRGLVHEKKALANLLHKLADEGARGPTDPDDQSDELTRVSDIQGWLDESLEIGKCLKERHQHSVEGYEIVEDSLSRLLEMGGWLHIDEVDANKFREDRLSNMRELANLTSYPRHLKAFAEQLRDLTDLEQGRDGIERAHKRLVESLRIGLKLVEKHADPEGFSTILDSVSGLLGFIWWLEENGVVYSLRYVADSLYHLAEEPGALEGHDVLEDIGTFAAVLRHLAKFLDELEGDEATKDLRDTSECVEEFAGGSKMHDDLEVRYGPERQKYVRTVLECLKRVCAGHDMLEVHHDLELVGFVKELYDALNAFIERDREQWDPGPDLFSDFNPEIYLRDGSVGQVG